MRAILSKAIQEKGLKKKYIAERLGIDPRRLSELINGKRRITRETEIQIAAVLRDLRPNRV